MIQRPPIHVAAYGGAGTRKSTLFATFPPPIVVACFDSVGKDMPYWALGPVGEPVKNDYGGMTRLVGGGKLARLEVFLYSDSAARVADATHLDRKQFVNATQEQTIKRERTLIENANLIGLLTSLNSHQRERASDALTAGPPQASSK